MAAAERPFASYVNEKSENILMLLMYGWVIRGNDIASLVEAGSEVGVLGVPREVGVPEGVGTEPTDTATRRRHGQGRKV